MTADKSSGPVPERELRLALVCYGGVSLAVYMHGITREILKLVRASRAYHGVAREVADTASYADTVDHRGELDTEAVYFRLLQQIGGQLRLRVLVDVIAGASAGGINGIMLARALAFDLSLDSHRKLWLELADVDQLLDPEARATRLSKVYMRPLFWMAGLQQRRRARRLGNTVQDSTVLDNLSLFMRSRWFEPPFSGPRMSEMMLDALESMGTESAGEQRSLLPQGQPLDLFVTTTDFWGYPQTIPLHDPPTVQEREHRHIFHFHHQPTRNGEQASMLGRDQLPSLAFAARATSSFPGAFPPARLAEIDDLLRQRECPWEGRDSFITTQFKSSRRHGEDAEDAAFIDGSVLMNKPVSVALNAVQRHAAHRQTDRRLVYLEPNPEVAREIDHEIPGFFKTIAGALSNIPRQQPIRDDLEWIAQFNEQVHLHREVADGVRSQVLATMGSILDAGLSAPPNARAIARWRRTANTRAAVDAGYAYEGYARLKVLGLLEELAEQFQHSGRAPGPAEAVQCMQAWARRERIRPIGQAATSARHQEVAPWVRFLRNYDIRYRLRRVLLLIRRSNELYTDPLASGVCELHVHLDRLKSRLYDHAEQLRGQLNGSSPEVAAEELPAQDDPVDAFLVQLRERLDLVAFDKALDEEMAQWCGEVADIALIREILTTYFGFAYYDVLTFPMTSSRGVDALEEIKVDRIAVDDANTLREGGARDILKGVQFSNFGAFFSRRFRENDYLWGRLTAAERLVDIVGSAAPEAVAAGLDLTETKKQLFLAILRAEAPHLQETSELIAELETRARAL
ncbi:patatin-like protein [Kineobactrum salinum]|uniref:Patatin-like protein n=1 Tax=Kineobactrum salinum TaxID=2708301 RepID=A0A6C0TY72_9GAMM|nr:patatin-like protein [Kineobactrum salinum]QIB64588.1 patatin-like protein [Kineobactrum salinum]